MAQGKNHSNYLRLQEAESITLSLYSDLATESGNGEEMIHSESGGTEEEALRSLEPQELGKALKMLDDDEYSLIYTLFLSRKRKTQVQLTKRLGLTQAGVSRPKKRILEKLKSFVIKSEKKSAIGIGYVPDRAP